MKTLERLSATGVFKNAQELLDSCGISEAKSGAYISQFWPDDYKKLGVISSDVSVIQMNTQMRFEDVLSRIDSRNLKPAGIVHALVTLAIRPRLQDYIQPGAPLVTTEVHTNYVATVLRNNRDELEIREGYIHGAGWPKDAMYIASGNDNEEAVTFYKDASPAHFPSVPSIAQLSTLRAAA